VNVDAENSAAMLVLRGAALDALPEGPGGLAAALRFLAVRSVSPDGPQIVVNGFSGGRIPPKSSIREIRINQNPFSAQYDQPGLGRVEILTKPGTDSFHAALYSNFNDESLNSRNPFAPDRSPFQYRLYGANLSGPAISKRTSFFIDFERHETDDNAVINATVLDNNLNATPFNRALLTPQRRSSFSPRLDYQLSENHILVARYAGTRGHSANAGIGEFSLPSRAYRTTNREDTFQLTETAVLHNTIVNEMRFQYIRERQDQFGNNVEPTIRVPEAFVGGGSEIGVSGNTRAKWEFHNTAMWTQGRHTVKAGGHLRSTRSLDTSRLNFGGTFTFAGRSAPQLDAAGGILGDQNGRPIMMPITTLESYRRTLLLGRLGFAPEQIRARGGGPTQFSIASGDAEAKVGQHDTGLFLQDDWRLRPSFTVSTGIRYEAQNHIQSNLNFAPRVAFAWSSGPGSNPKLVVRGGSGMFYERFSESFTLAALRFNGIKQSQHVVSDVRLLDRFPTVPPPEVLAAFTVPQTTTRLAERIQAPYMIQSSLSVERQLPLNMTLAATYINSRALHVLRSRNINAPSPETSGVAIGGLRPFGNSGEIFQYETSGRLNQNQLVVNLVQRFSKTLTYYVTYILNSAKSDTDGAASFPADSYDLKAEYGRSLQDIRQTFYWGGWIKAPFNIDVTPVLVFRSGVPFNITTGRETNGDTLFTERPAFAANTASPGMTITRFGMFDLDATAERPAIPRNFGIGPGFAAMHLRIGKTFMVSRESAAVSRKPGKPYYLTLSIQAQNIFNHTNPDTPVGNLSSPLFGRSYSSVGDYGFGANPAGNRRIEAQIHWSF
jgi:hypothetical protein